MTTVGRGELGQRQSGVPTLESISPSSFEQAAIAAPVEHHRPDPLPAIARSIPDAIVLAMAETVLALGAITCVLIFTNLDAMPDGIDSFLSIRVTLRNVLLFGMFATIWPTIFWIFGLYDASRIRRSIDERIRVIGACSVGSIVALILPLMSRGGGLKTRDLGFFWLGTMVSTIMLREVRRRVVSGRRPHRRVLFVGSGVRARHMWHSLSRDARASYELAGFVDTPNPLPGASALGGKCLGTLDQLEALLMGHAIDEVYVALPIKSHYPQIQAAILVCERVGVRTRYKAHLFNSEVAWPRYDEPGSPTVTLHVVPDDARLYVKRALDLVGAATTLVVLSPFMLAVALAIKATSSGSVIFAQERYGLNRRRFRMFKFRTMTERAEQLQDALEARNEADGPVFKIRNDPRVTPVGQFLRRTSIDELPQLINVLRGEMSLVGPRPLPPRDVTRFTCAADMRRFSVRPGLTCLWQISGRSTLSFGEWVRLDLKYIDDWSLTRDLLILIRTIPAIVRGRGAH